MALMMALTTGCQLNSVKFLDKGLLTSNPYFSQAIMVKNEKFQCSSERG